MSPKETIENLTKIHNELAYKLSLAGFNLNNSETYINYSRALDYINGIIRSFSQNKKLPTFHIEILNYSMPSDTSLCLGFSIRVDHTKYERIYISIIETRCPDERQTYIYLYITYKYKNNPNFRHIKIFDEQPSVYSFCKYLESRLVEDLNNE